MARYYIRESEYSFDCWIVSLDHCLFAVDVGASHLVSRQNIRNIIVGLHSFPSWSNIIVRMKNKENYNRLNVSQETVERDWKPSIKVGYQRNVENIDIEVSLKVGQNRKNVQTNIDEPSKPIGRRHRPDSLHSGRFNNSVYVKDTERNKMSSKAMKNEAYNRYHASSLFSHRS